MKFAPYMLGDKGMVNKVRYGEFVLFCYFEVMQFQALL
jgi:hypothetical protein